MDDWGPKEHKAFAVRYFRHWATIRVYTHGFVPSSDNSSLPVGFYFQDDEIDANRPVITVDQCSPDAVFLTL